MSVAGATRFPRLIGSALTGALVLVGLLGWRVLSLETRSAKSAPAAEPIEIAASEPSAPASRPPVSRARPRLAANAAGPVAAQQVPEAAEAPSTAPVEQAQAIFERRRATLTSPAQVDSFLDELRARARARHGVTASEVEPGFMAIRQLSGQLSADEVTQRQMAFGDEMARLSREYREGTR
jgi:hypothetical protein